jgi:hypothetical protein
MRLRAYVLAVLLSVLVACASKSPPASTPPADTTRSSATPSDSAAPAVAHSLVKQLPAGVEGLELTERGLRVKKGYQVVKQNDSTVAIARMSGGQQVLSVTCDCWVGVGCIPWQDPDGILTCKSFPGCIRCEQNLIRGGVRTAVFAYERRQQGQQQESAPSH